MSLKINNPSQAPILHFGQGVSPTASTKETVATTGSLEAGQAPSNGDVFVRAEGRAADGLGRPRELRPSALVRNSIRAIAAKFERFEKDEDMGPPVYWNTNAVERDARWGGEASVTHERFAGGSGTSVERIRHRGTESDTETRRTGAASPEASTHGDWTHPYSLTLGSWWTGRSLGDGIKAGGEKTLKGKAGSATGSAYVYAEHRTDVGAGGVLRPYGVEGGVWAKQQVVALGVRVTGEISSPRTKIGGREVDVHASVHAQPFVGADASTYAWVEVNARKPAAILSAGGSVFVGAKARAHADFGVGELLVLRPTAEAWAGAGAEAGLSVGYDDGKLSLGASAGAGLGVGGKLGFEVEVDVVGIGKAAHALADRDGDGSLSLHDAQVGLEQAGAALSAGARAVGDGAITVANSTMRAGQVMLDSAKGVVTTVREQLSAAASTIADRTKAAAQRVHAAIDRLGHFFGFSQP